MKKFKEILTDMRRTEKVQVRKYTRSKFGNFLFFAFLFLFGAFSVLPLIYSIATSFKPLDEILVFPPAMFTVKRPTLNNYLALPNLISGLNVPFSRYLTNSLFISIVGTVLHVLAATAAAFVLSKVDLKFKKTIFLVIQTSLLFNAYTLSIPRYIIYNELHIIDTYWVYILPFIPSSMGVFNEAVYRRLYSRRTFRGGKNRRCKLSQNFLAHYFPECKALCFNACFVCFSKHLVNRADRYNF